MNALSVVLASARFAEGFGSGHIATLDGRALPRTAAPRTTLAAGGMLRLGPAR